MVDGKKKRPSYLILKFDFCHDFTKRDIFPMELGNSLYDNTYVHQQNNSSNLTDVFWK